MMTTEEAVLKLRDDPVYRERMEESYLGADLDLAAKKFADSEEFLEILRIIGTKIKGATVLDMGAGTGIASHAFIKSGAAKVYALEPDTSDLIGQGAINRLCAGMPVEIISAFGENIPLPDRSVDVIYTRQVLHHTTDLNAVLRECARILKPGGLFIACREHVVDDENQLKQFLSQHPVHQLAGGENAYRLDQYLGEIRGSNMKIVHVFRPWDSVINAFPLVRSEQERREFPSTALGKRFGAIGRFAAKIPPISTMLWRY